MKKQMSDTIRVGLLLAIVGGFLDAYTYLCRGQVFANAQTGNMVLFGIKMMEGHIIQALYYALPILAFFIGIVIAEMIKHHFFEHPKIHWRQIVLMIEAIVILIVAFLPKDFNMFCNIMISFICSLQVESFRKFNGNPYASTMCTGNLRSATEHLYQYFQTHNKKTLLKSLQYFIVIFFFIIGACLGTILTNSLSYMAAIIPTLLLLSVIVFMFYEQVG
ncbi:MAG: YoaK family protein [Coprobacillus cateniformis]|uniref:YoaK family protein n=1 Tax=Coprobacillus cateniformis TaxID=100884 RepID=UPI000D7B7EE5|nr:YoaK family protein [Coprobacillus cateniformis]PWM86403.1 MAG: DUF1275 domain-containing protein [Coprobacillus sp.]MBS5598068.1 DUF1275 domain-containing protein [Coprobacillus cateniformis]MVX28977.1 DUF1275 domain-containing protein [Coprobacillus cateniformis]PWM88607.1 MAG: DUF1275 domain-containing protein [Coprobacillus sp.]RGO18849.1 DUF1275 domain-containing protein [Coprobacillus cateniformis]